MVTWSINPEKLLVELIFLISSEKLSCVTNTLNINVMRTAACLVINPIMVDNLLSSLIARRLAVHQTQG